MMQSPSDFNSFMALNSSLVKLALDVLDWLRILEISALNSSASVGLRPWQAISVTVIYSLYGRSWKLQQSLVHVLNVFLVLQVGECWIDLQPTTCLALMVSGPGLSGHFSNFYYYCHYAVFYAITFQIVTSAFQLPFCIWFL